MRLLIRRLMAGAAFCAATVSGFYMLNAGTEPTAEHIGSPKSFLALDTFESVPGQTGLPAGWERAIGYPGWFSLQTGKDGQGQALRIDGRKGIASLYRFFEPQTGIFTVELDVSMIDDAKGLLCLYLGMDTWVEDYEKWIVCVKCDNRNSKSPAPFEFFSKKWQTTKVTPEPLRWHHLKYVVNVPSQYFDLWIDGELAVSKCAFRNPGNKLSCLMLLTQGREENGKPMSPSNGMLVDNVAIYPTAIRPPDTAPVAPGAVPQTITAVAASTNKSTTGVPAKPGYKLTFHDEFDGNSLNMNLWNYGRFPGQAITDEKLIKEYYPYELKDGVLKLCLEKRRKGKELNMDNYTAKAAETYTAPGIATYKKFEQEYGWFEMRCKMPKAYGVWTGFWLYPIHGIPGNAEIDIFEALTKYNDRIFFTVHPSWEKIHKNNYGKAGIRVPGLGDDFHVYALNWEPGKLTLYVDGMSVYEYTGDGIPSGPLYIIVSCRTGGWGGNFVDESALPDNFEIDYVRVYQKE